MAMGTRAKRQRQQGLFYAAEMLEASGHPFYKRLNETLDAAGFDGFCEERCRLSSAAVYGRPGHPLERLLWVVGWNVFGAGEGHAFGRGGLLVAQVVQTCCPEGAASLPSSSGWPRSGCSTTG